MENTVSVSKGVFVFKNGMPKKSKLKKIKNNDRKGEPWQLSFKDLWTEIECKIESLHEITFSKIVNELMLFLRNSQQTIHELLLPTAAILTGINLPDHGALFNTIKTKIKSDVTPHIATLTSEDCGNLKNMIENVISQFVNDTVNLNEDDSFSNASIKKPSCNFATLETWYKDKYSCVINPFAIKSKNELPRLKICRKLLVIILPDFESLPRNILKDFILTLSFHLENLPIVLIFGVATSVETIHRTLPFQVTTKLSIQIFETQKSVSYLNEVLENVFLTEQCPFHLGGKPFTLLTDVFLFYDFSVKGFIQGIKFAMLQHFYENDTTIFCCNKNETESILKQMTEAKCQLFRKIPSFVDYIKQMTEEDIKIKLLANDDYFKKFLKCHLDKFHNYLLEFHVILRALHLFTSKLPKHPLGKQLREYYAFAVSTEITESNEFSECMKLLNFLSKDELINLILDAAKLLRDAKSENEELNNFKSELNKYADKLKEANTVVQNDAEDANDEFLFDGKMNRYQFKEKLLKLSKKPKPISEYETVRNEFFERLRNIFKAILVRPDSLLFHEIFFYENASSLKLHMVGSPRAAIHTALNDPQFYLQCKCCDLSNASTIVPSLPDLSVVYKLHLESSKFINMYDWLQAFVMIVGTNENDDQDCVSPELQARFTRAVAELQFLGFIKLSKKKTDHVLRLTWGSS